MDSEFRHLRKKEIEESVERTLLYYKLFNCGIRRDILHSFLLDKEVSENELNEAVESLIEKGIVVQEEKIVALGSDLQPFYNKKEKKINKALIKRLLRILKSIPFVSSIAFSGGTANYGIENHEDIDLFIITKPNTVYIVYIMIHFISLILSSRNILCINYMIDETAVEIEIQRDLFTAHQILALKPFKNEKYLNYFFKRNNWVKKHYPNYVLPEEEDYNSLIIYSIFKPLNNALKYFYRFRYKKYLETMRNGSIILTGSIIKLHTNDYRLKVLNEFRNQWENYLYEKNNVSLKAG